MEAPCHTFAKCDVSHRFLNIFLKASHLDLTGALLYPMRFDNIACHFGQ